MINTLSPLSYTRPEFNHAPIDPPASVRHKRGVALTKNLWRQGSTITISFSDITDKGKDYLKKNINLWQPHVNLKFNFVETGGDIRISGKKDNSGNWSKIGTDAKDVHSSDPTMHINTVDITIGALNHAIRHEFGHALGLMHEHQHPNHPIKWNKEAVYEVIGKLGEDKPSIDGNILDTIEKKSVITSDYDSKSVMHYEVTPQLTTDGYEVGFNEDISEGDKQMIARIYPPGFIQSRRIRIS